MNIIKVPGILQWVTPSLCWRIPTEKPVIYLTFDDGPIPDITEKVIETAKQYDARCTFFCVGDNVRKYPEIYEKLIKAGHSVGNHTFNHIPCSKTDASTYLENIEKAAQLINSNLFRPPHGKINRKLIKKITEKYKIIMWEVMSYDFDKNVMPEQCLQNVIKYARPGSIVVMHDSLKSESNMFYALHKIFDYFSKKNYTFEAIPYKKLY